MILKTKQYRGNFWLTKLSNYITSTQMTCKVDQWNTFKFVEDNCILWKCSQFKNKICILNYGRKETWSLMRRRRIAIEFFRHEMKVLLLWQYPFWILSGPNEHIRKTEVLIMLITRVSKNFVSLIDFKIQMLCSIHLWEWCLFKNLIENWLWVF